MQRQRVANRRVGKQIDRMREKFQRQNGWAPNIEEDLGRSMRGFRKRQKWQPLDGEGERRSY
jgi:hypothetical protein